MQTKIINLFAGPGAGKSTLAALVFGHLKCADKNVELVREFAKDAVWEENYKVLENQIYVFGKQLQRMHRLLGKVDVIITDAPLMNSLLYYDGTHKATLSKLIVEVVNTMENWNYYVKRQKPYNEAGRTQTEKEAIVLDLKIRGILESYNMGYVTIPGVADSAKYIVDDVLKFHKG